MAPCGKCGGTDRVAGHCRPCKAAYNAVWNAANPTYQKDCRREYQRVYKNDRRQTDLNTRLRGNLRHRLNMALRGGSKAGSAVRDLGCTIPELRAHLEARFQPGMTWENWGMAGWHVDHVHPLVGFDLTDREQFLKACHYTNLQPLWAVDNLKKGARHAA